MQTSTQTFQPEFDPSVFAGCAAYTNQPLPPFARLMAKQTQVDPSPNESLIEYAPENGPLSVLDWATLNGNMHFDIPKVPNVKYLQPEDHPFSLEWSTILEILSNLTDVDLMAVRWTCKLFMKYIASPPASRNIIAEAAVQVNTRMFKLLSDGTWYRGTWFSGAYKHQYVVCHNRAVYQSLHPEDFFAINAPIELLREMVAVNKCPFSWTAITFATTAGRLDVIRLLMDAIPDTNNLETEHRMIANRAIASGRADIAEALFNHERFTLYLTYHYISSRRYPMTKFDIAQHSGNELIRKNQVEMMRWIMHHNFMPQKIDAYCVSIEMAEAILNIYGELSEGLLQGAIEHERADIIRWMLHERHCTFDDFEKACIECEKSEFIDVVCEDQSSPDSTGVLI